MTMKANNHPMSKVLGGEDLQYMLPIFQREYAWEQEEWQTLWDDILEIYGASNGYDREHFLGSLVVIEEDSKETLFHTYTLVDGQQRLTSISLLLCALRDLLDEGDRLRRKINRYLLNDDVLDDLRFKILPTVKYDDRKTYSATLDGTTIESSRSRIVDAYPFFKAKVQEVLDARRVEPERLFNCLMSSLYIVLIELDRTDKPYRVFESLNHRGRRLTQADLVRNYIAMRLPPHRQQTIFDRQWSKIEDKLSDRRETARIPEFTAFLRHYIALQLGDLPRVDQVYNRFRDRVEDGNLSDDDFELEIQKLNRSASHYNRLLRPENEYAPRVNKQLKRLNILDATTAFPLLLHFYEMYTLCEIDECEFLKILRAIENYLVRRLLAGEPANYLNSMFTSLANELKSKNEKSAASLEAALGDRNYPSDNRLRQRLLWNRLYSTNKSRRIVFVFEALSRHINPEVKLALQGTVEHIMPQRLSDEWRAYLGDDWQGIQRDHLQLIGNLTIVSQPWNSKLSNSSFELKREQLVKQGLPLNTCYFEAAAQDWGPAAIRRRTNFLANKILEVWPAFTEPPRTEGVKGTTPYTLKIHDHEMSVQTWRGMVLQMVNTLHDIKLLTDQERALREFEWWMIDEPVGQNHRYKQSSAGWWIQQNLSAENAVQFCGMLAKHCGLNDDEWSFTYE